MPGIICRPEYLDCPFEIGISEAPVIVWTAAEGAEQYVLDCSANRTFEDAAAGLTWGRIGAEERAWEDVHRSACCWEEITALPSGEDFAVYRGAGLDAKGFPGTGGYRWRDIRFRAFSWHGFHRLGDPPGTAAPGGSPNLLCWAELGAQAPPYGREWNLLEACRMTWGEIGNSSVLDWETFERLPAVPGAWKTYDPADLLRDWDFAGDAGDIRYVYFRVKAIGGGEESGYTVSERRYIVRRETVCGQVSRGADVLLQIEGHLARSVRGMRFTLRYDPERLKFEGSAPAERDHGGFSEPGIRGIKASRGKIVFDGTGAAPDRELYDGRITELRFTARRSGAFAVLLESIDTGDGG